MRYSCLVFAVTMILASSSILNAKNISSKELIDSAASLDGQTVTYKGEAVAAVLNRGEFSWLSINDGMNAIGVWCDSRKARAVKFVGEYQVEGDEVEVTGTFNRACNMHRGELDIHASELTIVKEGRRNAEKLDSKRIYISLIMLLTVFWLVLLFRKRL